MSLKGLIPVAYEKVTANDTVKTLTVATYIPTTGDYLGKHALAARITVEDAAIRWTDHGTAPDGATKVGELSLAGTSFFLTSFESIGQFRCTREGETSALLHITYLFAPLPVALRIPTRMPVDPVTPTLP